METGEQAGSEGVLEECSKAFKLAGNELCSSSVGIPCGMVVRWDFLLVNDCSALILVMSVLLAVERGTNTGVRV
jgi:hypothetical protein